MAYRIDDDENRIQDIKDQIEQLEVQTFSPEVVGRNESTRNTGIQTGDGASTNPYPLWMPIRDFGTLGNLTLEILLNRVDGHVAKMTLNGDTDFAFSIPPPTDKMMQFVLDVTIDAIGGYTINLPGNLEPGTITIDNAANARTILKIQTTDGGVTYQGFNIVNPGGGGTSFPILYPKLDLTPAIAFNQTIDLSVNTGNAKQIQFPAGDIGLQIIGDPVNTVAEDVYVMFIQDGVGGRSLSTVDSAIKNGSLMDTLLDKTANAKTTFRLSTLDGGVSYHAILVDLTTGSGDVVGPGSSTDEAIARFDGITGKIIQNSTVLISDIGEFTEVAGIDMFTTVANNITNMSTLTFVSDLAATRGQFGRSDAVGGTDPGLVLNVPASQNFSITKDAVEKIIYDPTDDELRFTDTDIIAAGSGRGVFNIGHLDFVDNLATPIAPLSIYSDGTFLIANTNSLVGNIFVTPAVENLDMTGFTIDNILSLDIEDSTGATQLAISGPLGVGGRLQFALGNGLFFTENITDIVSIDASGMNLLSHDITMGTGGDIQAGGAGVGMTGIGHLDFVDNLDTPGATVSLYSDGTDLFSKSSLNMNNQDIKDLDDIFFFTPNIIITSDSVGMTLQVPTGDTIDLLVNGSRLTLSETQLEIKVNTIMTTNNLTFTTGDLTMGTGEIIAGGAAKEIRNIGELVFVNNTLTPAGNGILFFDGTDLKAKTGATTVNLTDIGGSNFTDVNFRVHDEINLTANFKVNLDGATNATTSTLDFNQTADRTLTFPNASGTVFLTSAVQDLVMGNFDITSSAGNGMTDIGILTFTDNLATPGGITIYSDGTDIFFTTGLDLDGQGLKMGNSNITEIDTLAFFDVGGQINVSAGVGGFNFVTTSDVPFRFTPNSTNVLDIDDTGLTMLGSSSIALGGNNITGVGDFLFTDAGNTITSNTNGITVSVPDTNDTINLSVFGKVFQVANGFVDVSDNSIDFTERATPASAINEAKLYSKDDGGITKMFYVQSDGTEIGPLGGGGSEFSDATFRIFDNVTPSKELAFEVSPISASTTRTITVQDADGTLPLLETLNTWTGSNTFTGSPTNILSALINLGDAATDLINVSGRINTNFLPNGIQNIGSVAENWNSVIATNFLVDDTIRGMKASGLNMEIEITSGNDILFTEAGTSFFRCDGGTNSINFDRDVVLGNSVADTINFTGRVNSNIDPSTPSSFSLGTVANNWFNVVANNFLLDNSIRGMKVNGSDVEIETTSGNDILITENGTEFVRFDGGTNLCNFSRDITLTGSSIILRSGGASEIGLTVTNELTNPGSLGTVQIPRKSAAPGNNATTLNNEFGGVSGSFALAGASTGTPSLIVRINDGNWYAVALSLIT